MKCLTAAAIVILVMQLSAAAQSDLKKLVDTEHAFAAAAAAKDTRSAFLLFMADDAVVFTPDMTPAKPFWIARPVPASLLSWAPNYADISSNGAMGYTTGNWEFRAKGKDDEPSAFGDFITIWMRQPSGDYRWSVDIGVSHDRPVKYSAEWSTAPAASGKSGAEPDREPMSDYYAQVKKSGLKKAYGKFAADTIRTYRENMFPVLGRANAVSLAAKEKGTYTFGNRSTTLTAADLSYNLNSYSRSVEGKEVESGNYLQIWKYIGGRWQMVLDIFKPAK